MVVGRGKARSLFRELDSGTQSILTRDALLENVNKEAEASLSGIGVIGGIGKDVLLGRWKKAAAKTFTNIKKEQTVTKPDKEALAVTNALVQPADEVAMTAVKNLGPPSQRSLTGARRAETIFSGVGLGGGVPVAEGMFGNR